MKFACKIIIIFVIAINVLLIFNYSNFKFYKKQKSKQSCSQVSQPKRATIFCLILTTSKNFDRKARVVYESWAKHCDNYKFISLLPNYIVTDGQSNKTNYGILLDYGFDILQPPGLENDTYRKLTDKVFLSFKYISQKYNDYDWYLKADDDSFVFVDNLRKFVSDKNPSSPVSYGYDFKVIVQNGYHSGGAGYLLSNEAVKRLGAKLTENYKFCKNSGVEDVDIARCLRRLGVYPNKSIDEFGRERFHPLNINAHYKGMKGFN